MCWFLLLCHFSGVRLETVQQMLDALNGKGGKYAHTYHVDMCLNMHDQHTPSFALGTLELMQNLNTDLKDHSVFVYAVPLV